MQSQKSHRPCLLLTAKMRSGSGCIPARWTLVACLAAASLMRGLKHTGVPLRLQGHFVRRTKKSFGDFRIEFYSVRIASLRLASTQNPFSPCNRLLRFKPLFLTRQSTVGGPKWTKMDLFRTKWTKMGHFGPFWSSEC